MITIAETSGYRKQAKSLLSEEERDALLFYLADHPEAGTIIEGAGGIRKLRWARDGKGKSGGSRVIYYYHSDRMPLYLLTIYGKGQKDNITAAEKQALKALAETLKKANRL